MRQPAIAPVLMLVLASAACDEGPTAPQADEEQKCTIPEGLFPHPPAPGVELPCQNP